MEEIIIKYPESWEHEYRQKGFVSKWIDEFPKMFEDYLNWFKREHSIKNSLSTRLGTLDLFPQYALMYLLRKGYRFHSLTWYGLCLQNSNYINYKKCQNYWSIMKKFMGDYDFTKLRSAIQKAIYDPNPETNNPFAGEPDLFCWKPKASLWFFVEAKKGNERLGRHQSKWFQTCQDTIKTKVKIYRLVPEFHK